MQEAIYYRGQAERARGFAAEVGIPREYREMFERMARDYDAVAEDLERGLIEIKSPSLLPQREQKNGLVRPN